MLQHSTWVICGYSPALMLGFDRAAHTSQVLLHNRGADPRALCKVRIERALFVTQPLMEIDVARSRDL